MACITPDIEQWLVADKKVVSRWRGIASLLGLLNNIEGEDEERKVFADEVPDREIFEDVLKVWKDKNPEGYNVKVLGYVLLRQGLSEMCGWISIITQDNYKPNSRRILLPRTPAQPPAPIPLGGIPVQPCDEYARLQKNYTTKKQNITGRELHPSDKSTLQINTNQLTL